MAPPGTCIETDGLRVFYEVYGQGEPLLLIPGGTGMIRLVFPSSAQEATRLPTGKGYAESYSWPKDGWLPRWRVPAGTISFCALC